MLNGMNTREIVASLDAEIDRLRQVKALLAGASALKRRGRPPASSSVPATAPKKRILSAHARARIAEAQRKRWAAQKEAATKKK